MKITAGQTVTLSNDLNEEVIIDAGGVLIFDPNKSVKITTSKNIENQGKIIAKPANALINHIIEFTGINENNFVGGGMVVLASDVGLWNMGPGVLDTEATYKKPFTNSIGDIKIGATSLSLKDVTGWLVGDEIVVPPMDMPPANTIDWDDNTNSVTDSWMPKFERRIITAINGTTVSFSGALKYDHLTAFGFLPYVANLTRNVKIRGTAKGRAHIFCCAHGAPNPDGTIPHFPQKHSIKNIEIAFMGPRKGAGRPALVTGRYALHFHHCGNGTDGTIVEGCVIHDTGNRCYVPHMAHGITMRNNVAFNSLESQLWWDWQEITHRTVWDGNLLMASRQNGIDSNCRAVHLSMGNDNSFTNNVIIYGHNGDNGGGAVAWDADNEGVWFYKNNVTIGCRIGMFIWQNSVYVHVQEEHTAINCFQAVQHGAYGNSYMYNKAKYYASKLVVKASAAIANGASWSNSLFDGAGKIDTLVDYQPSPAPGMGNVLRSCTFKNANKAIVMDCNLDHLDNVMKVVDVIDCVFENITTKFSFAPGPLDSYFRVQEKNGSAVKITKNGTTSIPQFAPITIGTGTGLTAEYYQGANFDQLAFTRIDPMIYYQQWRIDIPIYPLGPNDRVKVPFSVRWTGKVEAQWTEPHIFRVQGGSPYKIWVNGVLSNNTDSVPVNMVAGQKYDIKIEVSATNPGILGAIFYWKSPSMPRFTEVPYSQLFPAGSVIPPPPPVKFKSAAITGGYSRNNCLSNEIGTVVAVNISQGTFEADDQITADNLAKAEAQRIANTTGFCKPVTPPPMDPCTTFVWTDYLDLQTDLRPAGITTEAKALAHYNQYGIKEKRRANKLCLDPLLFPKLTVPPVPVVEIFKSVSGKEYTLETNGTLKLKP